MKKSETLLILRYLFGVTHTANKINVSNCSTKTSNYHDKRELYQSETDDLVPFCISVRGGFLLVACESAILKYSLEGHFIHKYPVEGRTMYVTVTNLNICGSKSNKSNTFCLTMANSLK